jgi:predicted DNA-binding transcriptional regulator AlpA
MSLATAEKLASLPQSAPPPERLWRRSDLATLFGVGMETIRNWERNGTLPKPVVLSRRSFWRPAEIEAFLARRGADG